MSQTLQTQSGKQLWVLVSSLKENTKQEDLDRITPPVSNLVDEWHSQGKFVWAGPLDNNKSGMAVFEATKEEAHQMLKQNKKITSDVLDSYLYQWEALPFLSVLN